jgi:hypothetical protein
MSWLAFLWYCFLLESGPFCSSEAVDLEQATADTFPWLLERESLVGFPDILLVLRVMCCCAQLKGPQLRELLRTV